MKDEGRVQATVVDLLTRFKQALETGQVPNVEVFAQDGARAILEATGLLEQAEGEVAPTPEAAAAEVSQPQVERTSRLPKRPVWDMRIHRRDAGRHHFSRSMGATSGQMQRIRPPSTWSGEAGGLGVETHRELTPG